MAFSYSFHLSSKSHAVTSVGKVLQCSKHNLREYKSASYDVNSIEILAGSHESVLDDFERIYHEEFDEALQKYNEGKRSDRQIHNYLEHVSESRADVGAEIIIQVGDQDFWDDKTMEQKKKMSYIFKDQLRSLEKLCPEFKIASAVVHYDEKSPHMHVIGIPVADGYEKGLSKQVAKTKIFTKERLSYLQDKMRENMEKGMELNRDVFGDLKLKEKEKGRNKDIPKHSLDQFYELQRKLESLNKERDELTLELEKYAKINKKAAKRSEEIRRNLEKYERPEWSVKDTFILNKEYVKNLIEKYRKEIRDISIENYNVRDKNETLERDIAIYKKNYKSLEDEKVLNEVESIKEAGLTKEYNQLVMMARSGGRSKEREREIDIADELLR